MRKEDGIKIARECLKRIDENCEFHEECWSEIGGSTTRRVIYIVFNSLEREQRAAPTKLIRRVLAGLLQTSEKNVNRQIRKMYVDNKIRKSYIIDDYIRDRSEEFKEKAKKIAEFTQDMSRVLATAEWMTYPEVTLKDVSAKYETHPESVRRLVRRYKKG